MKHTIAYGLLAFVLTMGTGVAYANEGASNSGEKKDVIKNCSVITTGVETRIKRFDTRKAAHYEQYTKVKARLDAFVIKAKEAGQDTSALEVHLVVLNAKITKFTTDYKTYIDLLKESKSFTCGQSEGDFKAKLEAARAQLKVVRADVKDIHNYLKDTIKPDIKALKATMPTPTPTPTVSPSPSPTADND